jgi:hypothetical protein
MTSFVDNMVIENLQTLHAQCKSILTLAKSLNGTGVLTNVSDSVILLSGSASGYSVRLPNATTLIDGGGNTIGWWFEVYNPTNEIVLIKYNDNSTFFTLGQQSSCCVLLTSSATSNGVWSSWQTLLSSVASGIINYNIVSSTPFTTSSSSDVVITGFTVTPQAGTYAIWVNGSWTPQAGPGNLESVTIYKAGSAITDSLRSTSPIQSLNPSLMCTQTITQVTGSQAIDVRIRSSSSQQLTVNQRSLLLIRIGT